MRKKPAVIGVLTEEPEPTWWKAHRHQVYGILGLVVGFYLGTHSPDAAARDQQPHPAHTNPAHSPTPDDDVVRLTHP